MRTSRATVAGSTRRGETLIHVLKTHGGGERYQLDFMRRLRLENLIGCLNKSLKVNCSRAAVSPAPTSLLKALLISDFIWPQIGAASLLARPIAMNNSSRTVVYRPCVLRRGCAARRRTPNPLVRSLNACLFRHTSENRFFRFSESY